MDNDNKIIKKIKQNIKKIKFSIDYHDLDINSSADGNQEIYKMIMNGMPGFVGRGGATEMRCIYEYLKQKGFSNKIKQQISVLSGVFPTDNKTLEKFCNTYIDSISKADIVALWGVGAESQIVHKHCKKAKFVQLSSLEPYYFTNPWSMALTGKKVLIIHPFIDSIKKQLNKKNLIWSNKNILPEFKSVQFVKVVQSSAGAKVDYKNWFDALESMKQEISKTDFDVAIIGAGAYGLPLAAYCKSIGKQAIQMAGATQILFGIKGKRWDNHPAISKFYNEYWIRPSSEETPPEINKVEGGSYW